MFTQFRLCFAILVVLLFANAEIIGSSESRLRELKTLENHLTSELKTIVSTSANKLLTSASTVNTAMALGSTSSKLSKLMERFSESTYKESNVSPAFSKRVDSKALEKLERFSVSNALQQEIIGMSAGNVPRETIADHVMTHYSGMTKAEAIDIVVAAHLVANKVQPKSMNFVKAIAQKTARLTQNFNRLSR